MTTLTLERNAAPEFITVASDLLGVLNVRQSEVLSFPSGLLGFPECRSFALVSARTAGLYWLQSVDYPVLAFLLVDPFLVFETYAVNLTPQDMASLDVSNPAEVAVLAIVTLSRNPGESATANLQGPVAVSLSARTGKQIAVNSPEFGVRCPLDLQQLAAAI